MNVNINSITGFEDAFVAMYISKRSWTPELMRTILKNLISGQECYYEWEENTLPY